MLQLKIGQRNFSAVNILRISIGIIYFWFGLLKFFHGYSPAEALAIKTVHALSFGMVSDLYSIMLLAIWECLVGIMMIAGKWVRVALVLLFVHMACTFTPLFLFPQDSFKYAPYGLSLLGQYIIKNIVIIASALVIWQEQKLKSKKLPSAEQETAVFILNQRHSKSFQKTI